MRLVFMINLLVAITPVLGQPGTTGSYKAVEARIHYGFIFAHSEAVQNTAGAHPAGVEVDLVRQRTDTAAWDVCHCYPTRGWSFSYFDFDSKILGRGFTTAYLLKPSYKLSQKAQFSFKGSIGLSYLTNPYHPQKNPTNLSYSTPISGFLQLGVGGSYQVASHWLLQAGVQYQHASNGGFKEPNKGINWPTASVGVTWYQRPYNLPVYNRRAEINFRKKDPYIEAGLFFSARQGVKPDGSTPRTPLVGVVAQAEKQVGRISALNTGLELYYDNALQQRLQVDSIDVVAWRAGLLAGHNFLLGKFFFSQQLGVYLYNRTPYYDRIYHRWTLRYLVNNRTLVGLGFKAHRHVADFFDLRVMYRW